MPFLVDDFSPAFGLRSGHAQSLFGVLKRPKVQLLLRRERRETPDGDFVDLDVLAGRPGLPTVVLLHGLEGSSSSGYIRLMLSKLAKLGWTGVALNARSCSGEPNRQAASYSSGDFRDLSWLVKTLNTAPLFAVGFSLGASVLLNFLAQDPAAASVTAAVAVSTPFDLARGTRFLDSPSPIARAYLHHFLPTMKAKALAKAITHPEKFDVKAIAATTRIRDFDHLVTAPLSGYASAEDYYTRCSTGPQTPHIRTPTLLLSSRDDAIAPPALPADIGNNPALDVLLTQYGGHVGFVGGSLLSPHFWAETRVMRWLTSFFRP